MDGILQPAKDPGIAQLLPAFYQQYNLGEDGGQSCPYVRIEFTKRFALYFPNFNARRKAVLKHDIHHLVTGYRSDFRGETEISAWELASGCRTYWAAWVLDLSGMMIGLLFNLPSVWRAFKRGRRTKNLYDDTIGDTEVLKMGIDETREILMLNDSSKKYPATFGDIVLFPLLILLGLIWQLLSLLALPFILLYSLYVYLRYKKYHKDNIATR